MDFDKGAFGSEDVSTFDVDVRHGFIRKVYGILTIQLLVTFGMVSLFSFNGDVQKVVLTNDWPIYTALGVSFAALIAIVCCGNNARIYPRNYILLSIFTLAEGYLVGVISAQYAMQPGDGYGTVAMAMGATLVVVLGLSLFACQTKYDFTGMGGYLFAFLLTLILFGFMATLFTSTYEQVKTVNVVYSSLGVLLFAFYIVYDTQLIVGGKHKKYQYGVDDYVFAALSLYLDVINMFLYILALMGNRN